MTKGKNSMDAVEMLTQFDLTRQEAAIYLALLAEGNLNGYEVAKQTGISRSNAYTSLAGLVEKGCAHVIEGPVTRYVPVSVEEFCQNKIRRLKETSERLIKCIPSQHEEIEGYITIKGRNNILDKMRNMIANAQKRVYLSAPRQIIDTVFEDICNAVERGIKMVLITDEPVNLKDAAIYLIEKPQQQIRLITDSAIVLTGDVDDSDYSTCLYSKKKNLVDVIKDSLKNEIRFIELTKGNKYEKNIC